MSKEEWVKQARTGVIKRCGNCVYMGEMNGEYLYRNKTTMPFHICENKKSCVRACLETAMGCEQWTQTEEDRIQRENMLERECTNPNG